VKSGLRFVEVDVPRSAVAALPRFAQDAAFSAAPADSSYLLFVAETECTNDAWRKWKPTGAKQDEGGDLPVVSVGGADIVAFCAEMGLELPYAAEWRSFALAAGESDAAATPERLGAVAWFKGNSGGARHPVKQLQPNAFGLYDVQGNVWEITLRDDEQWASVVSSGEIAPVVRPYLGGSCNTSEARCQVAKPEPAKDGPGSTRGFRPVYRPAWNR
jgi:formylglycine-generating enzyme required for sulfatase activity